MVIRNQRIVQLKQNQESYRLTGDLIEFRCDQQGCGGVLSTPSSFTKGLGLK